MCVREQTIRWFWVMMCTLAAAVGIGTSARAAEPKKTHVLAVGVNQYKTLPVLRGAVPDAQVVAALFEKQGAAVTSLLDEQATAEGIGNALNKIEKRAAPGDRVVIYLSGHGGRAAGRFQFAPYDVVRSPRDGADREKQSDAELRFQLLPMTVDALARGREVILVIDACHAGQIHKDLAAALNRKEGGGLVLLTSSIAAQTSLDGPAHGRFTQALLEALGGRADADTDGVVTLKEVRRYLYQRMKNLEAAESRMPGLPFAEQDFVCDASYSVSENLPLAVVRGKVPAEEPVKWVRVPEPKPVDPAKVAPGKWQARFPVRNGKGELVTDKDGNPLRQTYTLEFRRDGRYIAIWDGPLGSEAGVGRWNYSDKTWEFELSSDTGTNWFHIVSVSPESLEIRVFRHGPVRKVLKTPSNNTASGVPPPPEFFGFYKDSYRMEYDSRYPPLVLKLER